MTIIVYRDGILAADSFCYAGDRLCGTTRKIIRSPQGTLAGAAGRMSDCQEFLKYIRNDSAASFVPMGDDFGAIMIDAAGNVSRMNAKGVIYDSPAMEYHLEGAGEDIASGALEHGATAIEAVEIVCRLHATCGGEIQIERLRKS